MTPRHLDDGSATPGTALLTGVAGFIGSHLVDRLLARGHTVIGVDNFDPFYAESEKRANLAAALESDAFRLIEADCADPGAVDRALGDAELDVVIHLAAKAGVRPSIEDPAGYVRANVVATQAMLELARSRGVSRFVFGSSSSVYGNRSERSARRSSGGSGGAVADNAEKVPFSEADPVDRPISPYAATKRACELLCHTCRHLYGMSVLALRFFTVYGPRQRPDLAIRKFAGLMLDGEAIPMYGDGTTERDYTWIDDILDGVEAGMAWTAANPGAFEIVNLGESRTTSLARLIELIGEAVGVEPEIQRLPMQPGDVERTYADVTKAKRLLGYQPSMTVEEGIPKFVAWLKAHREANPTPHPEG